MFDLTPEVLSTRLHPAMGTKGAETWGVALSLLEQPQASTAAVLQAGDNLFQII